MYWKIFDKIFFIGAMSLGDSFVINGIVHHFADRCNELHLPIVPDYEGTLSSLYQDYPNIKVVPFPYSPDLFEREKEYCKKYDLVQIQRPPVYGGPDSSNVQTSFLWDQQVYALLELPFTLRYSNFKLPQKIEGAEELYKELNPDNESYILVHSGWGAQKKGVSLPINEIREKYGLTSNLKIIDVTNHYSGNMLHYIPLIKNASEIHCVASAFQCLVDSIATKIKGILFFHNIRHGVVMQISNPWNNYRWNFINYNTRI